MPKSHAGVVENYRELCRMITQITKHKSLVRFPQRSKDFLFASCGSLIPFMGLTSSGLFMGLISTYIYTSDLILCSTICVPSATEHNIHMYPYFLFAAIHHLNRSRLSLSDLVAQSAE